jgi:hypothetical protein
MRLIVLVAALGLVAASGMLALIYLPASYAQVARLSHVAYFEYYPDGPVYLTLSVTAQGFAGLRMSILALLVVSTIISALLLRQRVFRGEARKLFREWRGAIAALKGTLQALTRTQLIMGAALLGVLGSLQLFQLLADPLSPDELVSYDAFVHQGAVAITGFYPIPNNHVFYNLLCGLLKPVLPGHVRAIMRLPSFLVGTLGLAMSYALLTHFRSFRVATLVTALFGLSPIAIAYAASGRGYFVQLVCLQLAFFAVLTLATRRRGRRVAWVVFVLCCVAGLYTIPTFALPTAALLLVLAAAGVALPAQRKRLFLLQLSAATATVGLLTALLYWPVGCISGWPRLLGNRYLAPHSWAEFLHTARAYLYETAGLLYGQPRAALLLWAGAVAITPWRLLRQRGPAQLRWLAGASWVLVALPLLLMAARQLFIPARVLLFTTYFLYLLLALGAEYAWRRWRARGARLLLAGAIGVAFGAKLWEIGRLVPVVLRSRDRTERALQAYRWVRRQPPGAVFMGASYHGLLFYHWGLLAGRPLPMHYRPTLADGFRYIVWSREQPTGRPELAKNQPLRVAYRDEMVTIFTVPRLPIEPAHIRR